MNYPRLLFITSHAFNNVTGGGITFSNLLRDWPKDRLLTIHNDNVEVTDDVCSNYYFLNNEIINIFPFNLITKTKKKSDDISVERKITFSKKLFKFFSGIFSLILFGNSSVPDHFKPSGRLTKLLDDYKPDVIYTILGSIGLMELIKWVKTKYNCKLVVHIMDDWYSTKYKRGFLSILFRGKMKKLYHYFIKNADLRFSICDMMKEEYEKRFNVPFKSFHNAIDTKKWSKYTIKKHINDGTVRLLYIGSVLSFAQSESILDIAKAADIISNKRKIKFQLYVPNNNFQYTSDLLFFSRNTEVFNEIDDHKLFYRTISGCDILVLPSNFNKRSVNFIKYSMPTKVPAYMLSKTPILVYGSKETAQVKYALDRQWGFCVTERNINKLVDGILELIENSKLTKTIVAAAYKLVCLNHDVYKVKNDFQKTICKINKEGL